MFSQSGKGNEVPAQAPRESRTTTRSSGETSTISADLKVVGNLVSGGDIQIRGTIEGDVRSRTVTIGEGAHVKGAVVADIVHISGAVSGQVEAPTVTIAKTAKVKGDIIHQMLSIEAGAHIEGNCRRLEAKKGPESINVASLKPAQGVGTESSKKIVSAT